MINLIAIYAACLFIRQLKTPTRANNGRGNAEASIIFMEATLNGGYKLDASIFT